MKVLETTGNASSKVIMMYWEIDPKLRGKNKQRKDKHGELVGKPCNVINMYIHESIPVVQVGDKIVNGVDTLSCYTVTEVISSTEGQVKGFNYIEMKTDWKRVQSESLPERGTWIR